MTTCIKCGQPIPDGELFCESCGLNGEVPQPRPALRPAGRMQTPVKREPRPGKPQPAPAPEKKSRGGKAAAIVLALFCALLLAGGAFGYVTLNGRLREKQAEIDRLQEKTAFFDRYAVCVNDDGSLLYHRYGCARLEPDRCRIYSRKRPRPAATSRARTASVPEEALGWIFLHCAGRWSFCFSVWPPALPPPRAARWTCRATKSSPRWS